MFCCYLKKYFAVLPVIVCLLQQKSYAGNVHANSITTDTVKGTVVDEFSHPLAGVTINVKEELGTITKTNSSGAFSINTKVGNTLVFTLKNYITYVRKVTGSTITLQMLNSYLQHPDSIDVLYSRISADNNVGSVATIYTNQVTTTPATIYPYALPGRLSGLQTRQTSGYRTVNTTNAVTQGFLFASPTSFGVGVANDNNEISLTLRGQHPVTVIDGVQREISSIDFEDIESISVLKDALSTILMGQLSSNGVILVTTKKPRPGDPRISFTAQTGYQNPINLPTPLPAYQYAYLYNEALQNNGNLPAYTAEDFQDYRDGSDPIGHPNVNWYDVILRKNAPITKYNFTLNGGNGTASYMVSLGYLNQQGMFKDYNLEDYSTNAALSRYTINSNINVNVTKNFNVALQIFGRIQSGNEPGATTSALVGKLFGTPNNAYPIYNPDGSFGGNSNNSTNLFAQLTNSGYILDYARDIMVNVDLTYKFDNWVKGLWVKAKGNIATGYTSTTDRSKNPYVYQMLETSNGDTVYNRYGSQKDQQNAYQLATNSQIWYAQLATGIDKQYGKHSAGIMLMADQRAVTVNFDLPGTYSDLAGKATYNYANKYFAEGALNYSGCDRYQPGGRFGWFYAGGLGWKISEEDFIKENLNWVNLLKLRATYGKTGNANIGYFTYRPYFSSSDSYNFGASTPASSGGLAEASPLITQNATWEKANKFDLGLDFNVLNNTLLFTFDYYHDRYYDLMQLRGSSTGLIGSAYPLENIGINAYYGTEFSATYQNHYNNFNYYITGNISFAQSKIIYEDEIARKYAINRRTGQPVDRPFGYIVTGIIQTPAQAAAAPKFDGITLQPGDLLYKDINGDGRITQDYDIVPIGTNKPHLFYGTTLGFNYKGFDFSVLLQGEGNRIISVNYTISNNTQAYTPLLNRWTPATAATATLPRLTPGYNIVNTNPFVGNTFYQHSGNYFRVKNVDIGYNLPYNLIRHIGISGLRVFANAMNLFTQSGYDEQDPEVSPQAYPMQRVFNTGVTIKL